MWISTQTASLLTGKVTRTIYRWADEGFLRTRQENGRLQIELASLAHAIHIPLTEALEKAIQGAEDGLATDMHRTGLFFLEGKAPEIALRWFEQAARKGHLDAMDWLARCHADGTGTEPCLALALRWLGEAAAHGHPVAQAKVEALDRLASTARP